MSILLKGLGSVGVPELAAGYYFRTGSGAADKPTPTQLAALVAATTRFTDVGLNDHTTFEEITRPAMGDRNYVQGLYVHTSVGTLASYTAALYYGASVNITADYWNGTAWADWTGIGWIPNISSSWVDGAGNPTDRSTKYILLTLDVTGDGLDFDTTRIGDWRVS